MNFLFGGGMGGHGLPGMPGYGGGPPDQFVETYRCFPISFAEGKESKESGDKIILPTSAFEKLARMEVTYPMTFQLLNTDVSPQRKTHVGVLEFTAKEGQCFVPYWIMQNLMLSEGSYLKVVNVTLPVASFVKFRPRTVDFIKLSNPKSVLESTLRNFSCLTKGDQICLPYNDRKYYIDVTDVQPADACSIIEADINVDFDPPVGYEEHGLDSSGKEIQPSSSSSAAGGVSDDAIADALSSASNGSSGINGSSQSVGKGDTDQNAGPRTGEHKFSKEVEEAREERLKQLEKENAAYVAFSGTGRRIDGKLGAGASASASSGASASASASAPSASGSEGASSISRKSSSASGSLGANSSSSGAAKKRSSKYKSRNTAAAFEGEGRSLNS